MQENNQKKSQREFTIENLFQTIALIYIGQVKRKNFYEDRNYDSIYTMAIETIKRKIEEEPEKSDYYFKMCEVLDKFYDIMCDKEVGREIKEKDIKVSEFIKSYEESILGKDKRAYDMSTLLNADYIATVTKKSNGEKVKALVYERNEEVPYEFLDGEHKRVIMEVIGRLYIQQWNGIRSDVTHYRVKRQTRENEYTVHEVFSNIILSKLENPAYREAVLQELLSNNNISLANAGGYIGEITPVTSDMKEMPVRSEIINGSDYFYKINDQYALKYDGADLSAVMLYQRQEQEKVETQRAVSKNEEETR